MSTYADLRQRCATDERVQGTHLAKRLSLYPFSAVVSSANAQWIEVEGRLALNLGSNNYLGLAADKRTRRAAITAIEHFGVGASGSRLFNGTLRLHTALESRMAEVFGAEAALVFTTGYAANIGTLSALLGPRDVLAVDEHAHASLFDGVNLARARAQRFAHNDPQQCAEALDQAGARAAGCFVESIYSMHGDCAPVADMLRVCEERDQLLIVDEAHALGVAGPRGLGLAQSIAGCGRLLRTATFSKALGSCGGVVCGDRAIIDFLRHSARPFLFTASNVPASIAAAASAFDLLVAHPEWASEVQAAATYLKNALRARGIAANGGASAIVTIESGSDFQTIYWWRCLLNRGLYCNPALTPAVKPGEGVLRLSVMRTHSATDLDRAAAICEEALATAPALSGTLS